MAGQGRRPTRWKKRGGAPRPRSYPPPIAPPIVRLSPTSTLPLHVWDTRPTDLKSALTPRVGRSINVLLAQTDLSRDGVEIDTTSLSDPVVRRADGTWLYSLTSVIDDIEMSVTHIVRGEDHLTNSAAQIEMFESLGAKPPRFAHHNLLTLPGGEGMSKRLGHLSLQALRASGLEPLAVASAAILVGTAESVEPVQSLDALAFKIDF